VALPNRDELQGDAAGTRFDFGAVNLLTLRGRKIVEISGFVGPAMHRPFHLPPHLPPRTGRPNR
jgi:hypothetical protein